jgi:uncharacterized protein YndB with AHSA1/START domain
MPTTLPVEYIVTNDIMLSQTRVIRAPRARVYEAWTNPDVLKKWFGSAITHCSDAQMEVRVGGAYRFEVVMNEPPAGEGATRPTAAFGHFTKIVPEELLQFTWASDWVPGEESLVTVTLKDVAEGTELTVVHERFNAEASRDAHGSGWVAGLANLVKLLEG